MAARRADFSVLRGTLVGFVVCVLAAAGMLTASSYFKQRMAREYQLNHNRFLSASRQYLAVDEEERIIEEFYPEFVRLYHGGLLGQERRLSWLETLREAGGAIRGRLLLRRIEQVAKSAESVRIHGVSGGPPRSVPPVLPPTRAMPGLPDLDPATYDALRRVAHRLTAGRAASLQATSLLHEAWLKIERSEMAFESREHFLAVAAKAMRQILVNLVRNACWATRAGEAGGGTVRLVVTEQGERVCFEVRDQGVGIDPSELDLVFRHGFTRRRDGHGFGLHSSANTAVALGGELVGSSEGLGRGACFTLKLPREVPDA